MKQRIYEVFGAYRVAERCAGGVLVALELYFVVLEWRHVVLSGVEQDVRPLSTDALSMTWHAQRNCVVSFRAHGG